MLQIHIHVSCYVLSYVMKCENGMSEILKHMAKEFKDQSVQDQMKKILSTFANKREVSVHEAVKRVLSQWLFKKSRTVINISNHPAEERHRMPKSSFELADKEDDDECCIIGQQTNVVVVSNETNEDVRMYA